MEVSITQFRQDIFDLVTQAMEGSEVWVTYKGRRFRIAPENRPASRLARVTPLDVINSEGPGLDDPALREAMTRTWEQDWSDL
jgi:antitoxin (DNA-binding transcriptional repressor) of toxin-antitoxin stability system